MRRLFLSLLAALCFHLLLFRLPASYTIKIPPQATGAETIKISLTTPAIGVLQTRKTPTPAPVILKKMAPEPLILKDTDQESTPKNITATTHKKRFSPVRTEVSPVPSQKTVSDYPEPIAEKMQPAQITAPPAIVKAKPFYQQNPKPSYPAIAKRRNWQGTTILQVGVSKQGQVQQVSVQMGSGYEILDKSALRSVEKWHFLPGTEDGKPVAMEVLIPIHFKLH